MMRTMMMRETTIATRKTKNKRKRRERRPEERERKTKRSASSSDQALICSGMGCFYATN